MLELILQNRHLIQISFTLSESLNNVTEIELDNVHIPRSWYNFDTFFGNICFRVITGPQM